MITVNLSWLGSPAEEQITGYMIYQDGAEYGPASSPSISIPNVTPGIHTYEVAAVNEWGPGPHSDSVATPPMCSKIRSVVVSVTITA